MKPYKPTREQILEAANKTVPDVIAPNLTVLFCGINPGLYTAAIGHHFGRPGNRFWKALFEAGFTDHLFDPSEERELLDKRIGITNVVPRATAVASEVSKQELIQGGEILKNKIKEYTPQWLAVVGIGAYRIAFNQARATVGRQQLQIENTNLWVLPNPSGLNAHYQPAPLAQLFKQLRITADL